MKKLIIVLLCLLCGGCMQKSYISVKVLAVEEDRLFVESEEQKMYLLVSSHTRFKNIQMDDIQVNDMIEVYLDDKMMMSYPPQVNVLEIKKSLQ